MRLGRTTEVAKWKSKYPKISRWFVQVWDSITRQCLFSMSSHTMAITCVAWGGEGLLYSGARDCSINVWDAQVMQHVCLPVPIVCWACPSLLQERAHHSLPEPRKGCVEV